MQSGVSEQGLVAYFAQVPVGFFCLMISFLVIRNGFWFPDVFFHFDERLGRYRFTQKVPTSFFADEVLASYFARCS